MKEARHAEADAAWSFLDSEPEDAVLVLATERYASMDDSPSDGQGLFRLSRKEAEWVIRLKRGFPELQAPEHEAYVLFLSAIASWSDVFPLEVIEELLAYAPWRDDGRGLWSAFEADAARWQVIQLAIAMFTDGGASLPTDFATSLEAGLGRDVLVARTLPNGRLSYIDLEGELKALQAQISERGRERGSWRSTHER